MKQYHRIQVAVDGSQEADLAFYKAVDVAIRSDASLEILHVIDTRSFQNVSSFDSKMVEQVSADALKKLKEYYQKAQTAGVKEVHYAVEFGSAKAIIAHKFPLKHQIDLIVLGATGLNTMERMLIGSITDYVTRTANCDVLVCRSHELDSEPK